jgi:hypothetical protein
MTHNFHAIVGPNGRCECGVLTDGTVVTCGDLLEAYVQRRLAALSASGAGVGADAIRLLREVYQTHRTPTDAEYEAEPCAWCRAVAPILAGVDRQSVDPQRAAADDAIYRAGLQNGKLSAGVNVPPPPCSETT